MEPITYERYRPETDDAPEVPRTEPHSFAVVLYGPENEEIPATVRMRWNGVPRWRDECVIEGVRAVRADGVDVTAEYADQVEDEVSEYTYRNR